MRFRPFRPAGRDRAGTSHRRPVASHRGVGAARRLLMLVPALRHPLRIRWQAMGRQRLWTVVDMGDFPAARRLTRGNADRCSSGGGRRPSNDGCPYDLGHVRLRRPFSHVLADAGIVDTDAGRSRHHVKISGRGHRSDVRGRYPSCRRSRRATPAGAPGRGRAVGRRSEGRGRDAGRHREGSLSTPFRWGLPSWIRGLPAFGSWIR